MSDQIPAEIAEAIEALEYARQCHAWEAASGSSEAIAAAKLDCEASRAALDAVILKHIRGAVLSQHEPSQTEGT